MHNTKHRIKSAAEQDIHRSEQSLIRLAHEAESGDDSKVKYLANARERHEKLLTAEQRHIARKEKIKQKREEMIESALSPIVDKICDDPNFLEELDIALEANSHFFTNSRGNSPDHVEPEVLSKKHDLPADSNQEEPYHKDLEKQLQDLDKRLQDLEKRFRQHEQKGREPFEIKEPIKATDVVGRCISKLLHNKLHRPSGTEGMV